MWNIPQMKYTLLKTISYNEIGKPDGKLFMHAANQNERDPQPGEHPRLFFRKADLAMIRQRADTPEGKAIVARLRETLGADGEHHRGTGAR